MGFPLKSEQFTQVGLFLKQDVLSSRKRLSLIGGLVLEAVKSNARRSCLRDTVNRLAAEVGQVGGKMEHRCFSGAIGPDNSRPSLGEMSAGVFQES